MMAAGNSHNEANLICQSVAMKLFLRWSASDSSVLVGWREVRKVLENITHNKKRNNKKPRWWPSTCVMDNNRRKTFFSPTRKQKQNKKKQQTFDTGRSVHLVSLEGEWNSFLSHFAPLLSCSELTRRWEKERTKTKTKISVGKFSWSIIDDFLTFPHVHLFAGYYLLEWTERKQNEKGKSSIIETFCSPGRLMTDGQRLLVKLWSAST